MQLCPVRVTIKRLPARRVDKNSSDVRTEPFQISSLWRTKNQPEIADFTAALISDAISSTDRTLTESIQEIRVHPGPLASSR